MAAQGFTHQSNSRAVPLSRCWNRVIGHMGFEKKNWSVFLRGWYCLKDEEDEDPAIADYLGRGDVQVVHFVEKNIFYLWGVPSLSTGDNNDWVLQFDWTFPVVKNLKGHLQLIYGYGETLTDYNHHQTIICIGVSLLQ